MGKVTGFMEFERLEEGYEPVPQRIKNYKEFVIGLNNDQAKVQAAMDTNQREYHLKEQLKTIRAELGDAAGGLDALEQLLGGGDTPPVQT
jgi:ATP-dependent Lon protease